MICKKLILEPRLAESVVHCHTENEGINSWIHDRGGEELGAEEPLRRAARKLKVEPSAAWKQNSLRVSIMAWGTESDAEAELGARMGTECTFCEAADHQNDQSDMQKPDSNGVHRRPIWATLCGYSNGSRRSNATHVKKRLVFPQRITPSALCCALPRSWSWTSWTKCPDN